MTKNSPRWNEKVRHSLLIALNTLSRWWGHMITGTEGRPADYYLKYIREVSQILDYIHRFSHIHLMKGHFAGGATFYQGVLLHSRQGNRELIKMWPFTLCVMRSLIQFVPTHISVEVSRGSIKKHFCSTFSKKNLMAVTTLLSVIVFSRKYHNL